jgi:hypothetical protein
LLRSAQDDIVWIVLDKTAEFSDVYTAKL